MMRSASLSPRSCKLLPDLLSAEGAISQAQECIAFASEYRKNPPRAELLFDAAMTLESARNFALSLPETMEAPHHHMSSFRVRGKIYATVPPDGDHLHIFVDELETKAIVAESPSAYVELWWGKKLSGVRVTLSNADEQTVFELLESSWRMRAPLDILTKFDEGN